MRSQLCLALFVTVSGALIGCGPTRVEIDPKSVVDVQVQPASGQKLFCPGDAFQVEVVAKLKDGSYCSNANRQMGCMGESDAVIDPNLVRIEGSAGFPRTPRSSVWMPDPNPLKTADSGLLLRAWLEKAMGGQVSKTKEAQIKLRPVYDCQRENIFGDRQRGIGGEPGRAGPNLDIAVTSLSTPYYPNAALIRVETAGNRFYYISPSADSPVRIVSQGQPGAQGRPGTDGAKGTPGKDASGECDKGGKGGDGAPGGAGGPGGDGGVGGVIRVLLDERNADQLRGRVLVTSLGGEGGPGGLGGHGGFGGDGGKGGPSGPKCATGGDRGDDGANGDDGPVGEPGRPGADGPPASYDMASRDALFGTEMPILMRIEAARGGG